MAFLFRFELPELPDDVIEGVLEGIEGTPTPSRREAGGKIVVTDRLEEGAYALDLASLDLAERPFLGPQGLQALPGQARYRLKLLMEDERYTGFELKALGPQASDPCGSLRVDVQGIVTALGISNPGYSCL